MLKNIELHNLIFIIFTIIPIIIWISFVYAYRKKAEIISLMNRNISYKEIQKKILFIVSGLFLIAISLLQPVVLSDEIYVKKSGLDIYFFVDLSSSMLVEDVSSNRLDEALGFIQKIIQGLNGDRVGLIPFSSMAYRLLPLTDDYQLIRNYLDILSPEMASGGGTNIISAVKMGKSLFERGARGDKVIILISDGEFHNKSQSAATKLSRLDYEGIYLYSILVGTEEGGMIPAYDEDGNKTGYRKDQSGKVIFSRADQEAMKNLAMNTGGEFYNLSKDRFSPQKILEQFQVMKKVESSGRKIKDYKQLYQSLLLPGLILFLIGYFIPERVVKDEKANTY